jgi:mannosylglycerate hydrolase
MTKTPAQRPPQRVDIVPHTHWDREWYSPFQVFRLQLVATLDDLLADLETSPDFTHFLLDGQLAAVDDYLEVRPDQEALLARFNREGRIAMGPWYTLPDEFLVSGETLVRDLEMGMDRAEELGGPMRIGYLPDMFGHIAQMPQLLSLFGFEHAVVWRGVPAAITRTGFWWEAPDGTRVRAEYLPNGYGVGSKMPNDASAFVGRITAWIDATRTIVRDDPVLWMNGSDHLPHQPFLPQLVADAKGLANGQVDVRITSLAEHLDAAPTEDLDVWRGELRSGARANLLFGVSSNRVDVRRAAARAERALEQVAEPLWAAFVPASLWPERLLGLSWRHVVLNAAHDSVCACSGDEVVDAVLVRYAEARQIAEGLADQATNLIGASLAGHGRVVVNTLARTRSGLVELTLPGHEPLPHEQLLQSTPAHRRLHDLAASDATVRLEAELDVRPEVHGVEFTDVPDAALRVDLMIDPTKGGRFPARPSLHRMAELAAADPARRVTMSLADVARRRVLVHVADVPGLGWAPVDPSAAAPVTVTGHRLDNRLVSVEVDPILGTFALDGHPGLGRLVDDGDAGDTYNYNPPDHDTVVEGPEQLEAVVAERGPLRALVRLDATYRWPRRVDDRTSCRAGEEIVPVSTTVELRAGERFVRLTTTLDNRCEDHRLRAWFPLPERAPRSTAECAFTTVDRVLTAEGGPTEVALPTFPSRRFVQAGSLTVVHEGVLEYELVDVVDGTAGALALTLLRASRYLSRGPMSLRPMPAGPVMELAGSQVQGRHTLRYAVAIGVTDPFALAEDAFVDLRVASGAALGDRPDRHQALNVSGLPVSSVRRRQGRLEVRAFNPAAEDAVFVVEGRRGWTVDLRGNRLRVFDGTVVVRPHGIVTVALDEPS